MIGPDPCVGDVYTSVIVEDLSRAMIVQYAGASGDYNPLHHDEPYAVQFGGYDSVIAPGMLTMGLTAVFVQRLLHVQPLSTFAGRFRAPVLPGDTLTTTATVVVVDRQPAGVALAIDLETVNQAGAVVFTGRAEALLPHEHLDRTRSSQPRRLAQPATAQSGAHR